MEATKKEKEDILKIAVINAATGCGANNAIYFLSIYPDVHLAILYILKENKTVYEGAKLKGEIEKFKKGLEEISKDKESKKLNEITAIVVADKKANKNFKEGFRKWLEGFQAELSLMEFLKQKNDAHFAKKLTAGKEEDDFEQLLKASKKAIDAKFEEAKSKNNAPTI